MALARNLVSPLLLPDHQTGATTTAGTSRALSSSSSSSASAICCSISSSERRLISDFIGLHLQQQSRLRCKSVKKATFTTTEETRRRGRFSSNTYWWKTASVISALAGSSTGNLSSVKTPEQQYEVCMYVCLYVCASFGILLGGRGILNLRISSGLLLNI